MVHCPVLPWQFTQHIVLRKYSNQPLISGVHFRVLLKKIFVLQFPIMGRMMWRYACCAKTIWLVNLLYILIIHQPYVRVWPPLSWAVTCNPAKPDGVFPRRPEPFLLQHDTTQSRVMTKCPVSVRLVLIGHGPSDSSIVWLWGVADMDSCRFPPPDGWLGMVIDLDGIEWLCEADYWTLLFSGMSIASLNSR